MILLCIVLALLPVFFQHIERRNGVLLHDMVLAELPALNMSVPIFTCIWSMFFLFVFRSVQSPMLFMTVLYGFIIVCITRLGTISLVALNPPLHLVPLVDPISNTFYGKSFITKDLFYSGHTATQWLFFLSFRRKTDRIMALFCTIAVGFLVLVQHVHYTIDVLAAPLFTTICYYIGRNIVNSKFYQDIESIKTA